MDDPLAVRARDVCFAHWPAPEDALRPHLPAGLDVTTVEGTGWLTVVALEMVATEAGPFTTRRPFTQVNFRTYVDHEDERGVYFLSLDCGDRVAGAVAGSVWGLPFRTADSETVRRGEEVIVRSRRAETGPGGVEARFDARYRPVGESFRAEPGTLADELIERHTFYVERDGDLAVGEIERDPWELYEAAADVRTNTLAAAHGIDAPPEDVHVHYSPTFESTTGLVDPL